MDTASLGYGGNVYKQLVDGKSDEEKVKIESRLIAFQKKVAEIDSWLVDELNSLRHEGCHRLASANEADKQKLEEFKRNIESKEREIDQEMEVFVPEQHAELDKNGLLPSLSKKESLDTISEDLEVLIHDENV